MILLLVSDLSLFAQISLRDMFATIIQQFLRSFRRYTATTPLLLRS